MGQRVSICRPLRLKLPRALGVGFNMSFTMQVGRGPFRVIELRRELCRGA
jgi:hypothetical protein